MKKFIFFVCVGGAFLLSGCVAPDQYQSLEKRVAAIEMEGQSGNTLNVAQLQETFQSRLDESAKLNRENYAEINDEIQRSEERRVGKEC